MTASGFARALPRVLAHEGGYVNDALDPGGATNKGITYRVYDAYRVRKGLPVRDVRQIGGAEVAEIYRLQYWDAVKGDELPPGLDYVLFDGAVNSGPSQSIKWLQRALGDVVVDGQIGQATLAAVLAHGRPVDLIDAICDRRLSFLRALKTWPRFGKGWSGRVAGVRKVGKSWALGLGAVPIETMAGPTGKAPVREAKTLPGKGAADAATGGGLVTGGLGGALSSAREQLEPLAGASTLIATVVTMLVVAGIVLMAGGIAWRWYAARKGRALADALDLPQGVAA
ncbi:glycoside hydrolase family 108 protein [Bradyrhizobium sp. LHD-71]|uniref:glycoside hydrolase family 108 protein n=1 Tax=Bradyrhizobium sp. LHD-71 TaxID=3072141 RepID=UPI00280FA869|nr:glycoside hydrolase family 108 protein [Bradyrhizobium sp. LHD-71]MDQ8730492.1 glycoside hydrolase family 108 protein [Bradyrhizobium sp. LHD-71]